MIFSPIGRTDADGNTLTILLLLKPLAQIVTAIFKIWLITSIIGLRVIIWNIGKCKELVIDFSKKKRCFPPLTVDEVNIERVKAACILGLTVQDSMKWNEHNIGKKASKRLYMLRLLKRSNVCIRHLDYCIYYYNKTCFGVRVQGLALQYPKIFMWRYWKNSKTCIENHPSITKVWRSTDHD